MDDRLRHTVSTLNSINFQPSRAQCEIYLYATFQGGNGGLGRSMCVYGDWRGRGTECNIKRKTSPTDQRAKENRH